MSKHIGVKFQKEPEHKPAPAETPEPAPTTPKKVTKRRSRKAEK